MKRVGTCVVMLVGRAAKVSVRPFRNSILSGRCNISKLLEWEWKEAPVGKVCFRRGMRREEYDRMLRLHQSQVERGEAWKKLALHTCWACEARHPATQKRREILRIAARDFLVEQMPFTPAKSGKTLREYLVEQCADFLFCKYPWALYLDAAGAAIFALNLIAPGWRSE